MNQRPAKVAPEVVLAVWAAEDGRCEACTRAMDKRWAKVTRVDDHAPRTAENLHLLCVDCQARRPDPLRQGRIVVAEAVSQRLRREEGPEPRAVDPQLLAEQLRQHGVIVGVWKSGRNYWLPGVGTFHTVFAEDGTVTVDAVERMSVQPVLREKAQERTRGLPRPDRSPHAAPQQAPS